LQKLNFSLFCKNSYVRKQAFSFSTFVKVSFALFKQRLLNQNLRRRSIKDVSKVLSSASAAELVGYEICSMRDLHTLNKISSNWLVAVKEILPTRLICFSCVVSHFLAQIGYV